MHHNNKNGQATHDEVLKIRIIFACRVCAFIINYYLNMKLFVHKLLPAPILIDLSLILGLCEHPFVFACFLVFLTHFVL
jgi:hypothetical protein